MQVEHKTEKGTVLFVKVPDESYGYNVEIDFMEDWFQLTYIKDIYDEESGFYGEPCQDNLDIPKGNWQLIGLTSEVTEGQWHKILAEAELTGEIDNGLYVVDIFGYKDYLDEENSFKTAKESAKSIMQHLQVYETNPYGYECPIVYDLEPNFSKQLKNRQKWEESESRTGKFIVLFKPHQL